MAGLATFSDPNYAPAIAYKAIEHTLLISDKVFLFAPNAHAIAGVTDTPRSAEARLLELINRGFVVPVARRTYWDPAWRRERTRQFRKTHPERSRHYKWTTLDDRIVESRKIEFLPNNFFDSVTALTERLPAEKPIEFQQFVSQVQQARGHLPEQLRGEEYRTWSPSASPDKFYTWPSGTLRSQRAWGPGSPFATRPSRRSTRLLRRDSHQRLSLPLVRAAESLALLR